MVNKMAIGINGAISLKSVIKDFKEVKTQLFDKIKSWFNSCDLNRVNKYFNDVFVNKNNNNNQKIADFKKLKDAAGDGYQSQFYVSLNNNEAKLSIGEICSVNLTFNTASSKELSEPLTSETSSFSEKLEYFNQLKQDNSSKAILLELASINPDASSPNLFSADLLDTTLSLQEYSCNLNIKKDIVEFKLANDIITTVPLKEVINELVSIANNESINKVSAEAIENHVKNYINENINNGNKDSFDDIFNTLKNDVVNINSSTNVNSSMISDNAANAVHIKKLKLKDTPQELRTFLKSAGSSFSEKLEILSQLSRTTSLECSCDLNTEKNELIFKLGNGTTATFPFELAINELISIASDKSSKPISADKVKDYVKSRIEAKNKNEEEGMFDITFNSLKNDISFINKLAVMSGS